MVVEETRGNVRAAQNLELDGAEHRSGASLQRRGVVRSQIDETPWTAICGGKILPLFATRADAIAAVRRISSTGFATVRDVTTNETWKRAKHGSHWLCHRKAYGKDEALDHA